VISLCIAESKEENEVRPKAQQRLDMKKIEHTLQDASDQCLAKETEIRSDSLLLNSLIDRSLRDLHLLKTNIGGQEFFAGGVPWFVTLFGRDSLIASLQTLAYDPGIAEQTLRLLAKYQGKKVDEWRDEQPGKIMHELRVGEMAHLNEIPQTPYYGTIDATPLFLILVARHAAWTGELRVFNDLRDSIEEALKWMSKYGDRNADGYLEYDSSSKKGLSNQGWKDSGDAIVNEDGSLAKPRFRSSRCKAMSIWPRRLWLGCMSARESPTRETGSGKKHKICASDLIGTSGSKTRDFTRWRSRPAISRPPSFPRIPARRSGPESLIETKRSKPSSG
jgi:glycogen debranching enzyme